MIAQDANRSLSRRREHHAGVLGLGRVNRLLSFFERVGHVAIGGHDRGGGMHIQQDEPRDFDSQPVRGNDLSQTAQTGLNAQAEPLGAGRVLF